MECGIVRFKLIRHKSNKSKIISTGGLRKPDHRMVDSQAVRVAEWLHKNAIRKKNDSSKNQVVQEILYTKSLFSSLAEVSQHN